MTEEEWENEKLPTPLILAVANSYSSRMDRKMRLVACACHVHLADKYESGRGRGILTICYNLADAKPAYRAVWRNKLRDYELVRFNSINTWILAETSDLLAARRMCEHMANEPGGADIVRDIFPNPAWQPRAVSNPLSQVGRVSCRPFEWVFHKLWVTKDAMNIAKVAYAKQDFASLPVLADSLEEAGCDRPEILMHLRGKEPCREKRHLTGIPADDECPKCHGSGWQPMSGPHHRGCWALDLVLGKE